MIQAAAHALFRDLVDQAPRRCLLTTHMNPDGDGIGSEVGLARLLRSRNHEVRLVNHDPTPDNLRFLDHERHPIEVYDPARHDALLAQFDLIVLVDNSTPDRLGRMEAPMLAVASKTLCIDHHPTRGTPWAHNILDQEACATAAMIYDLGSGLGWKPGPRAAEALYVGIATDTGFFRFNSTNAQAHLIAAELLKLGVDPAASYRQIYERNSEAFTRLMGLALSDLRIDAGGAVVSVRVTAEMIRRCRAGDVDTSEMMTSLLSIAGVCVALLFRELPDGRVKVSLRSKGDVDVHRLATEFRGGGHRNASGIVVEGGLDDVADQVIGRAAAVVDARPRS